MKKIKNTRVSKIEALKAKLNVAKLKNSLASRKTNYKKNAIKAGVSYADYVMSKCGVTLDVFEDYNWSLPQRASNGTMPAKGTPEYAKYKRIASRKTYTKQLMEFVTAVDESTTTVEQFVDKYTDAADVAEFYSDDYNAANKGCYNVKAYAFLSDFH